MPFIVTMPKLSPTMEEGVIAKWHKKEGDFVESGDLLLEVTTDKATVEHQALDEGYLRQLVAKEGKEIQVNEPIAIFSETLEEDISSFKIDKKAKVKKEVKASVEKNEEKTQSPQKNEGVSFAQPVFTAPPPLKAYQHPFPKDDHEERLMASPLARKLAKEKGLDLSTIEGSGPGGRIVEKDLEMAQKSAAISFGKRQLPKEAPGSFHLEPLTPMRKAIGKRLQSSKTFIPHFYVEQTVYADAMVSLREQLKVYGVKLTYNDLVLKACALALKEVPGVNCGYDSKEDAIINFHTVDISVAVSVDGGLITPIIRYADCKNVDELGREVKALAKKAKEGKLQPEEYQGGSFTISNLGMYGIDSFSAVINPPQAAILAVGGLKQAPIVKNDQLVPGYQMKLVLSCDHRVIDGALGAQFLKILSSYLENPVGLLV